MITHHSPAFSALDVLNSTQMGITLPLTDEESEAQRGLERPSVTSQFSLHPNTTQVH